MSECEIAKYYVAIYRVARKQHECCECAVPIEPKEKYLQVNACWDGSPDVYRQHLLCQQACEFIRDSGLNDDDCIYYGGLKEWYDDWTRGFHSQEGELEQRQKMWGFMLRIARRERKFKRLRETR